VARARRYLAPDLANEIDEALYMIVGDLVEHVGVVGEDLSQHRRRTRAAAKPVL
jgi:hypothetical protein